MNRKEVINEKKSFLLKVLFLLILLIFAGCMYIESGMVIDAVYFGFVLVILIRFLIMKLYR